MALFHCSFSALGRGSGRSAVAAAAYQSGSKLFNPRTGLWHDYSKKRGVVFSKIIAPPAAPTWVEDREQFWGNVEQHEKRQNARLAKIGDVALAHELSSESKIRLTMRMGQALASRYQVPVDVAVHLPHGKRVRRKDPVIADAETLPGGDERNDHAHFMVACRSVNSDGFGARVVPISTPEEMHWVRAMVAKLTNEELEAAGIDERVDHRSNEDRGRAEEPTPHIGAPGLAMAERGERSKRVDEWRAARKRRAAQVADAATAVANVSGPFRTEAENDEKEIVTVDPASSAGWRPDESSGKLDAALPEFRPAQERALKNPATLRLREFGVARRLIAAIHVHADAADVTLHDGGRVHLEKSRIVASKGSDSELEVMVAAASASGWARVTITGDLEFRRRAAVALTKAGIAVADLDLAEVVASTRRNMEAKRRPIDVPPPAAGERPAAQPTALGPAPLRPAQYEAPPESAGAPTGTTGQSRQAPPERTAPTKPIVPPAVPAPISAEQKSASPPVAGERPPGGATPPPPAPDDARLARARAGTAQEFRQAPPERAAPVQPPTTPPAVPERVRSKQQPELPASFLHPVPPGETRLSVLSANDQYVARVLIGGEVEELKSDETVHSVYLSAADGLVVVPTIIGPISRFKMTVRGFDTRTCEWLTAPIAEGPPGTHLTVVIDGPGPAPMPTLGPDAFLAQMAKSADLVEREAQAVADHVRKHTIEHARAQAAKPLVEYLRGQGQPADHSGQTDPRAGQLSVPGYSLASLSIAGDRKLRQLAISHVLMTSHFPVTTDEVAVAEMRTGMTHRPNTEAYAIDAYDYAGRQHARYIVIHPVSADHVRVMVPTLGADPIPITAEKADQLRETAQVAASQRRSSVSQLQTRGQIQ